MRRGPLLLLLVVAILATGCSKAAVSNRSAEKTIAVGDRLAAEGKFDEALDSYLVAASQAPASSAMRDDALRKASIAVSSQVATQPLPKQVEAMRTLLGRTREAFLPLYAHNWLSERLQGNARSSLKLARAVAARNETLLKGSPASVVTTAAKAGAKKPAKKTTVKKPAGKTAPKPRPKPAPKPASRPATGAAAVATLTPTAASTATAAPLRTAVTTAAVVPAQPSTSPSELKRVATMLPSLGQPPAMGKLYMALAELQAATDASLKARGDGTKLTFRQARTLRAVNDRLTRAVRDVQKVLTSEV